MSPTPTASPTASPTPLTVALDAVARHPSGVTMRLRSLTVRREGVTFDVQVTNGSQQEALLAWDPAHVTFVDDTDTELSFVPPEGNEQLRVAVGDELTGSLAFRGAVGDAATSATIRFNYVNGRPVNDDLPVSEITSFEFTDLPLSGPAPGTDTSATAPTGASTPLDISEQHPGGVNLEISSITTRGDAIFLSVRVVNTDDDEPTTLAVEPVFTWLEDDLGNRYALRPPDDGDGLRIGPGEELVGDIAFVGPIDPQATSLALRTNHLNEQSPINLDKPVPGSASFRIDDIPVP